jgi:hypothetical protein
MVRTALYQAAHVLMHHGRWSGLRDWAMRIAKRSSAKLAKVALARKLAVLLHAYGSMEPTSAGRPASQCRLWRCDPEQYQQLKQNPPVRR